MVNKQTVSEYGVVTAVRQPIVLISGLPTVRPGEILKFDNQTLGQVFSFTQYQAEVVAFSNEVIKVGSQVERVGQSVSIAVPKNMMGIIIDPLGRVVYGETNQEGTVQVPLDQAPPPLITRRRITHRLKTGMSVVDLMLPLAKGQRELIAGDKKTGKTSFAHKFIRAQTMEGSIIIYAAIAKKKDEIKRLYQFCQKYQTLNNVAIVASYSSDSPGLISLTPMTAMSVAEYYRDQGKDVVIILDDLSTHAQSYREISLLAKRFPGRDSYPGDIFYLHARLLERSGTFIHPLDPEKTVSITCLPLAETTDGDLTNYIISNLISITDGHLFFDTSLYQQGRRPAVHHSLSVTRVGKQTQSPLERNITKELSSFFASYDKTINMTHFSAELTDNSRRTLRIGAQLEIFFTETSDLIVPKTVQQLFVALVWHGWLANVQSRTLQLYRDKLVMKYYQDEKLRQQLDKLTEVETFVQLLEVAKSQQQWLLSLCQT